MVLVESVMVDHHVKLADVLHLPHEHGVHEFWNAKTHSVCNTMVMKERESLIRGHEKHSQRADKTYVRAVYIP